MALTLSKLFMRQISQNPNENQTGVSLWTLEDVHKAQEKQKQFEMEQQEEQARQSNGHGRIDEYDDGGIDDADLDDLDVEMGDV
jgi:DNA excision repair protein ERCC-2